jgi:hypothetical protein
MLRANLWRNRFILGSASHSALRFILSNAKAAMTAVNAKSFLLEMTSRIAIDPALAFAQHTMHHRLPDSIQSALMTSISA